MVKQDKLKLKYRVALAAFLMLVLTMVIKGTFWPGPVSALEIIMFVGPAVFLAGYIGDTRGEYRAISKKDLWL